MPATGGSRPEQPPNILLVVVDDMGWRDIGYNDGGFPTPNIDAIAAAGVKLTNFYVAPTCTPTRAQLMTGRYNFRTGMQDSVIHSTEPRGVPLTESFLSDKLQALGYETAQVGKWHLGMHMPQYTPPHRGFNMSYGILTGGGDHFEHVSVSQSFTPRHGDSAIDWAGHNLVEDGEPSQDNALALHSTELYGKKARDYVSKLAARDAPWFLYLAFQAVHDPIDTDESWYTDNECAAIEDPAAAAIAAAEAAAAAKFAAAGAAGAAAGAASDDAQQRARIAVAEAEDASKGDRGSLGSCDVDWAQRRVLCGMMAQLDDQIGRLRGRLERSGEWEDTVIFFMSDNGGICSHGSINLPLAGEKGSLLEGGVRVPAFVGGGFVEQRLTANALEPYAFDGLWHVTDVHATALRLAGAFSGAAATAGSAGSLSNAAAGAGAGASSGLAAAAALPHWPALDGIDQWEAIVATKRHVRESAVLHMNSEIFGESCAVVMPPYKLVRNPEPSEAAIFNKVRARLLAKGAFRVSHEDLLAETAEVLRLLNLATPDYLLFDLDKNPGERTDSACEELAACSSVWASEEYSEAQAKLLHFYHTEAAAAATSTFRWADDGPLANPGNFGGVWLPWRDADGFALAQYGGLADPELHETVFAAQKLAGSDVGLAQPQIGAIAMLSVALAVAVGAVMFRLGKRSTYSLL